MYTYKLGGMLITDELYHDDLEAMTFGRKDQNELMHYGIKGQSWGKRRFQNEDGSLTTAGRNRYDVGDPLKGVSAFADTGGRGGSGVNYNRLSGGTGGSTRSATANQAPARLVGSNSGGRATTSVTTTQKVANTTNAGRKAADSLFGRIGNWASNAAKDVGNFATNTYNDASKAVTNAANTVGNTVKNVAQDVSDWYTGDKAGKEAQRYDNVVQNFERNGDQNINAGQDIISRGLKYPESAYDLKSGQSMRDKTVIEGLDRRNLGYDQHDIARQYGQKADEAQAKYEAAPRQVINSAAENIGNAAKDAGNWLGNAFNDAKNWVDDRAQDVGNAATNVYNDASKAVGNAAQGVKDWYTGDKAAREAQRYDNVVQNFERNGERNINEGTNTISRGINAPDSAYDIETGEKWGNKLIDEGVKQRELGYDQHDIAREYGRKADEAQARYDAAPRQLLERAGNWVGDRVNDVGNAAKDVGDWASNAASDVRDWGAGALDKGRQAFESLFGRSEAPKAEISDPNPTVIPENIIREQIIPEQRITENRIEEQKIPEQRIEEQRVPESIVREGEKYAQMTPDQRQARMDSQKNKPTVNGSNNVQTWDNANINTWDNVQTFGDPDMVNAIKMLNDNGFFNRGGSSNSSNNSSMSDKPSNVSDEYWRDYTSNGGTRDSYDRQMQARQNSQNNQNSSASRQEVVGTVDTSRPYHFTYDPASGQTIVVYDDEKRR